MITITGILADRLILNIKSPDTERKVKVKIIQYKKKKKV